jgi:pimeloyl-ACP methyl ester carboxylesterase
VRTLRALSLLALVAVLVATVGTDDLHDSYVGWYRLVDGGDIPAWLDVDRDAGQANATMSFPAQAGYGLAFENVRFQDGRLTFSRKNPQGVSTEYAFTTKDGLLLGEATRNGRKFGELRLRKSAFRARRGDGLVDVAGCYRADDGAALRVSAWAWKELRCLDLSNGSERTLFLNETGDLCAGTSLYGIARIEAQYRVVRDRSGKVTGLARGERLYRRIGLVERDVRVGTVSGTLLLPDSEGLHPVAVILGGSDVKVRADVRWEAEILASFGVAAFSYDLSGQGSSTGKSIQTFDESAQDVSTIVDALAKQPGVDTRRIGLCGTSRGGWLGPLVAARDKQVGFLVLLSAPAVSPREQLTSCRLNFMRSAGHGDTDLAEAKSYLDLTWKCHRSDKDWDRYFSKRQEIERRGWLNLLQGPASRESEEYAWQKLNLEYDPLPALSRVRCPVLCLYGSADQVVEPSLNAPLLASALAQAGNRDWIIRVVPDASHGLTLVDPTAPFAERRIEDEYGFAPSAWETVRRWLQEH